MNQETKAILTILIREIQDCGDMKQVRELTDSWVKANDLHPEEVETYLSTEALREVLKGESTNK